MHDSFYLYIYWTMGSIKKTMGHRPKDDWMRQTAVEYWKWNIGAYIVNDIEYLNNRSMNGLNLWKYFILFSIFHSFFIWPMHIYLNWNFNFDWDFQSLFFSIFFVFFSHCNKMYKILYQLYYNRENFELLLLLTKKTFSPINSVIYHPLSYGVHSHFSIIIF